MTQFRSELDSGGAAADDHQMQVGAGRNRHEDPAAQPVTEGDAGGSMCVKIGETCIGSYKPDTAHRDSEMSSQIIPLKAGADSQDPSRIPAMETTRV